MGRVLFLRRARALSLVVALGLFLSLPVVRADTPVGQAPSSQAPAAPAWEKIGDDDGIVVYRREVPGSPLIAFKGEAGAKEAGKLRLEGKEYIVKEGDVMHFRFNV